MTIDAQTMLDMVRSQLNWLEREILILRQALGEASPKSTPSRTIESLRGIWADVTFGEEDFKASRLELPDNL